MVFLIYHLKAHMYVCILKYNKSRSLNLFYLVGIEIHYLCFKWHGSRIYSLN